MLPLLGDLFQGCDQPTHYRISVDHYAGTPRGTLKLIPMREATAEDLRPPLVLESEAQEQSAPTQEVRRDYTLREKASLRFPCPYCGVSSQVGCVTRTSGRKLRNYPEAIRWTHSARQELVTPELLAAIITQEEDTPT